MHLILISNSFKLKISIINISNQNDPIGCVLSEWQQPTGLTIKKMTTPIGVIGVIYEIICNYYWQLSVIILTLFIQFKMLDFPALFTNNW